jgi:hypothetical protein
MKAKTTLAAVFFAAVLLSPLVVAADYCLGDNRTLVHVLPYQFVYNVTPSANITKSLSIERTEVCSFGCDSVSNSCNSDPFFVYVGLAAVIIVFFAVILWIRKRS